MSHQQKEWVLQHAAGPMKGWYWTGFGLPDVKDIRDALKFSSRNDARRTKWSLEREKMGRFTPREYKE